MNVQCPSCQGIIAAEEEDFGSAMQCGQCGGVVQIPEEYGSSGVLIGRDFILRDELGRGGAGSVHLAYQISLDREVAVKLLHAAFASDQHQVEGFVREARTAAKLNHPNIVRALAVGHETTPAGPLYYIAMELVRGQSVMAMLRKSHSLPYREALRVAREAAVGLAYAWDTEKLLHRDIKPDNLMVCEDNSVKLADLGLAMPASEVDLESDQIDGTPQYISPEYLLGDPLDVRSDIYSLGATLYHMITGQFVFVSDSGDIGEIMRGHVKDRVRPPDELDAHLPKGASEVICKMLEKDPAARYDHPDAVAKALSEVIAELDGESPAKPAPVPVSTKTSSSKKLKRKRRRRGRSANSFGSKTDIARLKTGEVPVMASSQTGIQPAMAGGAPAGNGSFKWIVIGLVGAALILLLVLIVALSGKDDPPPVKPAAAVVRADGTAAAAPAVTKPPKAPTPESPQSPAKPAAPVVAAKPPAVPTPPKAPTPERPQSPAKPAAPVVAAKPPAASKPPAKPPTPAVATAPAPQVPEPEKPPAPTNQVKPDDRGKPQSWIEIGAAEDADSVWRKAADKLMSGDFTEAKKLAVRAGGGERDLDLIKALASMNETILNSYAGSEGMASARLTRGVVGGQFAGIHDGRVHLKEEFGDSGAVRTHKFGVADLHLSERLARSRAAGEEAALFYRGILALAAKRPAVARQSFERLEGDLAAALVAITREQAVAAGANLMPKGDFEGGDLSGWAEGSARTAYTKLSQEKSRSGDASLEVFADRTGQGNAVAVTPLDRLPADGYYLIKFAIWSDDGHGVKGFRVNLQGAAGGLAYEAPQNLSKMEPDAWHEDALLYGGGQLKEAELQYSGHGHMKGSGRVFVDDFGVFEAPKLTGPPADAVRVGDVAYWLAPFRSSKQMAEAYAKSIGAGLLQIRTKEEEAAVLEMLKPLGKNRHIPLGGDFVDGKFTWADGNAAEFHRFKTPDKAAKQANVDYALYYDGGGNHWQGISRNRAYPIVLEWRQ